MKYFKGILLITAVIIFSAALTDRHYNNNFFSPGGDTTYAIDNYFKAGSKPGLYEIGKTDDNYNGSPVYYLRSTENVEQGFGTIMNQISPQEYLAKRIRMSAYIKCESIDNYAGMWFRIDGYTPGTMLGFDNMNSRPIEGTKDWQKYEIVLDVPDTASALAYGVLIHGNGSIWLSGLEFESVGSDVETTNMLKEPQAYNNSAEKMKELPLELANIPDGIEVTNSPINVNAVKTKEDTTNLYWFHNTSVKASKEDLEITEFGSYYWMIDHWQFGNTGGAPFSPKDFADWYSCKGSKLKKGKVYSDANNWYRWPSLVRVTSLWYYIGKNKKGELFKGIAIVNYLPEMKK